MKPRKTVALSSGLAPVMTIEEVAAYLKAHKSTIYKLVKRHEIPAFRIGSDWRFNRDQIDKWMARND